MNYFRQLSLLLRRFFRDFPHEDPSRLSSVSHRDVVLTWFSRCNLKVELERGWSRPSGVSIDVLIAGREFDGGLDRAESD